MKQKNLVTTRVIVVPATAFFLFLISGCTAYMPDNGFSKEIVNTEPLRQINRIALLDVPHPSKFWLGSPAVSGVAAGLFGPLVALAGVNHKGDSTIGGFNFSKTTQNQMRGWLEQSGIGVMLLEAKRVNRSKMLEDYSQFTGINADAILEVAPMQVGFREDLGNTHFTEGELSPEIWLAYRLISLTSGETLIESNVYYSSFDYSKKAWTGNKLLGPRKHIFKDSEAVNKQPEEAARRLDYAISGATELIAVKITNGSHKLQFSVESN